MVDTGFSLIGKVLDFFAEFETFLFVIRPGFLSSWVSLSALRRSARGAKRRVYSSQNYTRSEATSFILCFLDLFLLFDYSSQNYTRSEATSFILYFLDLFLLFDYSSDKYTRSEATSFILYFLDLFLLFL